MYSNELNESMKCEKSESEKMIDNVESGEKDKEYDLDETLDMIGFGKVQVEILFVFGVLLMMVVNETMGMSIITIASQCDFNTNSQEKAYMGTACVVGILLASYFWGYISDTYGRRTVLLRATIGAIICSTISMFVSKLWIFIVLRFFTGIGVAGASATIYAYLGEFNTPKYRSGMINYASAFVGISTMYSPGYYGQLMYLTNQKETCRSVLTLAYFFFRVLWLGLKTVWFPRCTCCRNEDYGINFDEEEYEWLKV